MQIFSTCGTKTCNRRMMVWRGNLAFQLSTQDVVGVQGWAALVLMMEGAAELCLRLGPEESDTPDWSDGVGLSPRAGLNGGGILCNFLCWLKKLKEKMQWICADKIFYELFYVLLIWNSEKSVYTIVFWRLFFPHSKLSEYVWLNNVPRILD